MNLKSYLRGAGIALITASLVLSFSGGGKAKAMTDDEVRARAKELGMTEQSEVLLSSAETAPAETTVAETAPAETVPEVPVTEPPVVEKEETPSEEEADTKPSGTPAEETKEDASSLSEDEAAAIESSLEGKQTTDITSDVTGEDKKKVELIADAAETENETDSAPVRTGTGFISVHISSGSSSTTVAKALEQAGAVSNAAAFDSYLCAKGYDRRLASGDFRIPAGSGEEDIALILMRRK